MLKTIVAGGATWLALLFVMPAPGAAQNREHQQLSAELRQVQEQNQQLTLAIAQLTEALKAVNVRLDANEQFQQRRFADQENLVKNLGSDLSAIRERSQDIDRRMRSLSDEIDALSKTFLSLPALISQAQAPSQAAPALDPNNPNPAPPLPGDAPPAVSSAPTPTISLPPTAGLSPIRLYDTAFSDYGAGQYTSAIAGFEQVIKYFPDAQLADDAQFLIGDSLSHLKRFQEAITAYNLVIQKYPNGDQVEMAYHHRGTAESQLGRTELARATWEELVKRYPKSLAADLARQRLKGLSGPSPTPPK
jgi:tol-pal system protein YbgF